MATRGRPRNYTLEIVIDEAFAMVEEFGVDGLSILGLARRLGTGNATLYNYVGSRDELIDLMLDHWLAQNSPVPAPAPNARWQAELIAYTLENYRAVVAHPVVLALSQQRPNLHLAVAARSEEELGFLEQVGFSAARAAEIQQMLALQLIGHMSAAAAPPPSAEHTDGAGPRAAAAAQHLAQLGSDGLYVTALHALVAAFAAELDASSPSPGR